ncbi:NADH-ubiquinone oxidoreductase chain 4 [Capsicum annuum]|nr:NADH-ubiquinone oxidoreductase chain 4 [Capsicum annuum]
MTTPNVTHPPPTYRLGGTSEIQLRERGSDGGRGEGKGLGLPILIGPHKRIGAVERFHIAETKDSTSIRDRSMLHRLIPAATKSTDALYSDSLIRKIALGYYGGSVSTMPNISTIFFSSTLANMSSPGTSSFIGEFLILVGAFQRNSLVATLAALGMILGAAYSLWLYNRAVFGNLKPDFLHKFSDPNGKEVFLFIPFLIGGVTIGPDSSLFDLLPSTHIEDLTYPGQVWWRESQSIFSRIPYHATHGDLSIDRSEGPPLNKFLKILSWNRALRGDTANPTEDLMDFFSKKRELVVERRHDQFLNLFPHLLIAIMEYSRLGNIKTFAKQAMSFIIEVDRAILKRLSFVLGFHKVVSGYENAFLLLALVGRVAYSNVVNSFLPLQY